jgi:hypothetical protein
MEGFELLATPWWVNLALLTPIVSYVAWRSRGVAVSPRHLVYAAVFAIAFGINEAALVVYLRAAVGLLTNTEPAAQLLAQMPQVFVLIEVSREAATVVMLGCASLLAAATVRERWALFLWMFAFWDVFYYAGLWLFIGWPPSLLTGDVLFLIPIPWLAQVWFPLVVSLASIAVVLVATWRGSVTRHQTTSSSGAASRG